MEHVHKCDNQIKGYFPLYVNWFDGVFYRRVISYKEMLKTPVISAFTTSVPDLWNGLETSLQFLSYCLITTTATFFFLVVHSNQWLCCCKWQCYSAKYQYNAGVTADLDPPRIWTPRSISASGFGPPFADLDPPTKHSFFPIYSNCKLLGDVL